MYQIQSFAVILKVFKALNVVLNFVDIMSEAYTDQDGSHSIYKVNRSLFNETTSNVQEKQSEENEGHLIPVAVVSLLLLISFLGAIGNLLVLKAIFSLKKRKLHEYVILNLATTDAGTCLVSIPLDVAEQVIGRFPYGAALCRVIYPLQSVLVYVSVLTLLFMSVERYRLIVTPMKPRIRVKTGIIAIAVTWILSCLIVLPFSLALKFTETHCSENWPQNYSGKIFTITIFIFLYLIPLVIMAILYSSMIHMFYKENKSLKARRRKRSVSMLSIELRLNRNFKIVKLFVVAVVVFALCMLPTHITWLWHDFGHGSSSPNFGKVVTFSNILMYANSTLNPCILGAIMFDVAAFARRCGKLVCFRSSLARSRRQELEPAFVLNMRSPSMSMQYENGSSFPFLSKPSFTL